MYVHIYLYVYKYISFKSNSIVKNGIGFSSVIFANQI